MTSEPKAFASLSSGLLARKGAARPAMRPQGFGQGGSGLEDLGWNDMGYDSPKPSLVPVADDDAPHHHRSPLAGLTPASPVHDQQAEIEQRLHGFAEGDGDESFDEDEIAEVEANYGSLTGNPVIEEDPESEEIEEVEEAEEAEETKEAEEVEQADEEPVEALELSEPVAEVEPSVSSFREDEIEEEDLPTAAVVSPFAALVPFSTVERSAQPEVDAEPEFEQEIAQEPELVLEAEVHFEPEPVAVIVASEPIRPVAIARRPISVREPRAEGSVRGKAAFTLRLDPLRHLKLRLACAVTGRSAQQLVTLALDELLASMPELDAMAERAPAERVSRKG